MPKKAFAAYCMIFTLFTLFLGMTGTAELGTQNSPGFALKNGMWFNGSSFELRKVIYSADGCFTLTKPSHVDHSLDLKGLFIVPPFGEAHNHNLGRGNRDKEFIHKYLKDGVFYVKILGNVGSVAEKLRMNFNNPTSVDVSFAHGPLTATGGHPIELREKLLAQGRYPGFTKETLKDDSYFTIDSTDDLEKKWPLILSFHPDFIKTMLWHSEEFEKRKDDPAYFGRKGLDPKLLRKIVEKAHAHEFRVSVHVVTAADFHHAAAAGVDEIAHLPGAGHPAHIDPEDAKLAAERGIVVVPTAVWPANNRDRKYVADAYEEIQEAQKANLKMLHECGVPLAIGSDDVSDTSVGEFWYLYSLGVFDNLALLKMWTETSPKTTFPERKIGQLLEGWEASFLALEGNPIEDLENVRKIKYRFKRGYLLEF